MLITREEALAVAGELVTAWNARRDDRLLNLMRDDIVFQSPLVFQLLGLPDGTLRGKAALAPFLRRILLDLPHTRFETKTLYCGLDGFVLAFTSIFEKSVAGVFSLDASRLISAWSAYFESLDLP